jgi:uncharacterized repeat protein (TIGR01451 family)
MEHLLRAASKCAHRGLGGDTMGSANLNKEGISMRKVILKLMSSMAAAVLSATAGTAFGLVISPFTGFTFNNPIGIDFHEPTGELLMSVNYDSGLPHNFDLVAANGTPTQFSTIAGLTEEVKIATVRASAHQGGFSVGEAFSGNGVPGAVVRISPTGVPATLGFPYTWTTLPGETTLLRGSLFQDRFGVAGGDLIVATGNEETGDFANDHAGNVWRVNSTGVGSLVANIGRHLEGVTTVPNDPVTYGPLAGKIIAGDEDFINIHLNTDPSGATSCNIPPNDPSLCNGPNGKIWAIDPSNGNIFTIGNGEGAAPGAPACIGATGLPTGCHYHTATAFNPEDLDIIRHNADFFGVAFRDGKVLTATSADPDIAGRCGQVFITQEFPLHGTSGLLAMRWDAVANTFVADPLAYTAAGGAPASVQQWEHATFTSGQDCFGLNVVKSPKNGTFSVGGTLTYSMVVTNTGGLPDHIVFNDKLPTNGGLTWVSSTTTSGSCTITGAQLSCDLGTVAAGASVTITVTSATVTAATCQDQPNNGIDTATGLAGAVATDNHGNSANDTGDATCTVPPQLKVVKSPKNGTFTQGGKTSFTIVVSNPAPAGASAATNVMLSDQLPGNGGLIWTTVTTTQGSCSIASNKLTCSLGTIQPQGSVTITVSSDATTPAAACQSQPNPDAHATADGGLVADDSGALTCTPPPPGGLIAPTGTTCQQFTSGTASALGEVDYSVSGGTIKQNVTPGVFFYYAKITVGAGTVTVSETQNDAAALFQIQQNQAYLWTADCSTKAAIGTLNPAGTGASFTVPAGTYIVSVKYDTKSIAGTTAPTSDPVTYTFTATPPGGASSASVLLKKN